MQGSIDGNEAASFIRTRVRPVDLPPLAVPVGRKSGLILLLTAGR